MPTYHAASNSAAKRNIRANSFKRFDGMPSEEKKAEIEQFCEESPAEYYDRGF